MSENVQKTGHSGQKYGRVAREWKLVELAGRQHAMVSAGQLRRLGLGPDAVRYRARIGGYTGSTRASTPSAKPRSRRVAA